MILENYSSEHGAETGAASNEEQASSECFEATATLHGDDHVP